MIYRLKYVNNLKAFKFQELIKKILIKKLVLSKSNWMASQVQFIIKESEIFNFRDLNFDN